MKRDPLAYSNHLGLGDILVPPKMSSKFGNDPIVTTKPSIEGREREGDKDLQEDIEKRDHNILLTISVKMTLVVPMLDPIKLEDLALFKGKSPMKYSGFEKKISNF